MSKPPESLTTANKTASAGMTLSLMALRSARSLAIRSSLKTSYEGPLLFLRGCCFMTIGAAAAAKDGEIDSGLKLEGMKAKQHHGWYVSASSTARREAMGMFCDAAADLLVADLRSPLRRSQQNGVRIRQSHSRTRRKFFGGACAGWSRK